jgi:hypothetical protein
MKFENLRVGVIHSIIGKNDGVSIVVDQSVKAMLEHMHIPLGNIFFLCALSPARFHVETDEVFWHKNDINAMIVKNYSGNPPKEMDSLIMERSLYAKAVIASFVKKHKIDLLIAHNTSHPYNFITAVGLGLFMEEKKGGKPDVIVWWHDSFLERPKFKNPNTVVSKYLKYLPGIYAKGMIFINSKQPELARGYFKSLGMGDVDHFLKRQTCVIPNTYESNWKWKIEKWEGGAFVFPPQDSYNKSFFDDVGLTGWLKKRGIRLEDSSILLQHTRIVPRKKIETAIDLAFALHGKFKSAGREKCVVLLVSGHSGDEQEKYKDFLKRYFKEKKGLHPGCNVLLLFGESIILPEKEIIVDKKYYRFQDIASIVASVGGIGTYFSEMEGYGNNLLEMIGAGLPAVVNRYDVFQSDIEPLGFDLPSISGGRLSQGAVNKAYELLTDIKKRNALVKHNLEVLGKKLGHRLISRKLSKIIEKAESMRV